MLLRFPSLSFPSSNQLLSLLWRALSLLPLIQAYSRAYGLPQTPEEAESHFPIQGNRLSAFDLESLVLGMSKLQVEELLGKSLLRFPFSSQTWYYVELNDQAWTKPLQEVLLELDFDDLQVLTAYRYKKYSGSDCLISRSFPEEKKAISASRKTFNA